MKKLKSLCTSILLLGCASSLTFAQSYPVIKSVDNGPDDARINFVYLSEGYTSAQLSSDWPTDVASINSELFNYSPFKEYANFFNVYRIDVPSVESGADHPGTATDVSEPASPVRNVNTHFNSTFDLAGIHRLVYVPSLTPVFTTLANNYPGYDQALLVINDPEYGGAGGAIGTTSTHPSAPKIAVHEFGHSFSGLADEYSYGSSATRGESPNLTAESDPTLVKWSDWIGTRGITVELVQVASGTNWYRPLADCGMRQLNKPFCAVCEERTIDVIYGLVTPIEDVVPTAGTVQYNGVDLTFDATLVLPNPNTLQVDWILDGTSLNTSNTSITLTTAQLGNGGTGNHNLVLRVTDATPQSRSYPVSAGGYVFEETWLIENLAPLPVEWLDFMAYAKDDKNELRWSTASEKNADTYQVLKSKDLNDWETVGNIAAKGNSDEESNYSFTDYFPYRGVTYYKVIQKDLDGSEDSTPIKAVKGTSRWFYRLFPNPTNGPLGLEFYTSEDANVEAKLYTAQGQLVVEYRFDLTAGTHIQELNLGPVPQGIYTLQLSRNDGEWSTSLQVVRE